MEFSGLLLHGSDPSSCHVLSAILSRRVFCCRTSMAMRRLSARFLFRLSNDGHLFASAPPSLSSRSSSPPASLAFLFERSQRWFSSAIAKDFWLSSPAEAHSSPVGLPWEGRQGFSSEQELGFELPHVEGVVSSLADFRMSVRSAGSTLSRRTWRQGVSSAFAFQKTGVSATFAFQNSYTGYHRCRYFHSELQEAQQSGSILATSNNSAKLLATTPEQKPRIVVLGTGWAGSRLMKSLNTKLCDIVCISPRNHMVFTPLLASTCVGTLEFRSVAEPIIRIQPALSNSPQSYFFLSRCIGIDPVKHEVHCVPAEGDSKHFSVTYDKLVIAAGAQALTFNIQGVQENAIFLREVTDAEKIREQLLLNLMVSDLPGRTEEEKKRLLHCVVVGGGPTGVEFSGELSDFIRKEVHQRYSHVQDYIHVTLIEAKEILSSFDVSLRSYAIKHLTKAGVKLVTGVVKDVQRGKIILSDGSEVPFGLLVWSTGVGPSDFMKSLDLPKSPNGRIGVDERLKVVGVEDVYAIGDCAGFVESVGKPPLPALAQVAERQGKYLARELNRILKHGGGRAGKSGTVEEGPVFIYKHLGSMATVGRHKALIDLRENKESKGVIWAGFLSWLVWRSAYLTRVISWRNRCYVAYNWATTFVFGRDLSQI